jgi:hypothetical protein
MSRRLKRGSWLALPLLIGFLLASHQTVSAPAILPNPIIYFMGTEAYKSSGKTFIRYRYDVFNKDQYPQDLFAPAPNLPPCGANKKSSRTWVDLYDQAGKRLYGFCALAKREDLNNIYFALEEGVSPPSWIYIELTDRQTNTKYKSNLAETTN